MATHKELVDAARKIRETCHGITADVVGGSLQIRDPSGTTQASGFQDTAYHLVDYATARTLFPAAHLPEETP